MEIIGFIILLFLIVIVAMMGLAAYGASKLFGGYNELKNFIFGNGNGKRSYSQNMNQGGGNGTQTRAGRKNGGSGNKIFSDDEGTYVKFEEIKD